jgi:hypothetical protein
MSVDRLKGGSGQKKMPKTTNTVKPKTDRRKTTKLAPVSPEFTTAPISDAEIARRAYEVYCERGGQHGRDLEDWLQAERELRTQVTTSAH